MAKDETKAAFDILIVDDEPKNIQLLGNLLTGNGYHAEFALSGEQAIQWLDKRLFDLVLLDIMMPDMDGYDVCRKIKEDARTQHIPIIFITAKNETDDIVKGFDVGGADYVTKPFRPPELLARVRMQVEMKTLRGLLPICANCKDIRDEQGVWNKIEDYIIRHSAALFSHGLCPKCVKELYGDEDWCVSENAEKEKTENV